MGNTIRDRARGIKMHLRQEGAAWSEIYLDFATFLPVLTASLPVYSEEGTVLGVCATDVQLPVEFRQFLSSLRTGHWSYGEMHSNPLMQRIC